MQRTLLALIVGSFLLSSGASYAAKPERDISGKKHPNLAAAQRLAGKAYEKIVAAQRANEWDMGGHASKAKELLDQASAELKQAAEAASKNAK